jgi:hypothetical protein
MKVRNFSRILLVVILIATQGLLGMNQSKKNELKVSPRAKKVAFGTLGVLGAIALGALLLHNSSTNNKEAPASPPPAPAFSPLVPDFPRSEFYSPFPDGGLRFNEKGAEHILQSLGLEVNNDRISKLVALGKENPDDKGYQDSLLSYLFTYKKSDLAASKTKK